jgi:PST family polysaccharide transporter
VTAPTEHEPSTEVASELASGFPPSNDLTEGIVSRRRAVRAGTLATLALVTSQTISFIGFIVLARLAPPRTFGAYAAASILLGVGMLFTDSGMRAAVIQRQDRLDEAASTAFAANILGGLVLGGVAAASAPLIGHFFHSGEITRAAAVLAGIIPIHAVQIVPGALLQRRVSFRLPFIGVLASTAYVAAGIVTLANGLGVWGLVVATYAAAVASTAGIFALSSWRPSLALISQEIWWSLSRYGRPVVLSLFLREVGLAGSTAVVGRLLGPGDLGRFRFAQRVALQISGAVVTGSAYVLLPAFARIWQDEKRFQASVLRSLRTLTLIVFPLSLSLIPLGQPFATIFLEGTWEDTGSILIAMSGVGIALALDSISSEAFKATGRTELLPRMHGLTAAVPIALMLAFKDRGAAGMGLAMSLGMLVVAAYALWALSGVTHIPFRIILSQIRPAATGALLMAAGVYLLDRQFVHAGANQGLLGLFLFALDLLLAGGLYLGSLLLVSRNAVLELREVAKLLVGRIGSSRSSAAE